MFINVLKNSFRAHLHLMQTILKAKIVD